MGEDLKTSLSSIMILEVVITRLKKRFKIFHFFFILINRYLYFILNIRMNIFDEKNVEFSKGKFIAI